MCDKVNYYKSTTISKERDQPMQQHSKHLKERRRFPWEKFSKRRSPCGNRSVIGLEPTLRRRRCALRSIRNAASILTISTHDCWWVYMCTEGGTGREVVYIFYPYSKGIRFLSSPKQARVRYLAAAALQQVAREFFQSRPC